MSPTIAELRAINPIPFPASMSNARGIVKTPVWLKRFMHQGWAKSARKWKGEQTETAVASFLAKSPEDFAKDVIKTIVESEEFPTHVMNSIFRRYRREKDRAPKGRTIKQNVMTIDAVGVLREQSLDNEPRPLLTEAEIAEICEDPTPTD